MPVSGHKTPYGTDIGLGSFEAINEFIEALQKEHPEIIINEMTLRKYKTIEELEQF